MKKYILLSLLIIGIMLNFSISHGMKVTIPAQYAAMLGIDYQKEAKIAQKERESFIIFSKEINNLIQSLNKEFCLTSAEMQQKTIDKNGRNKNYYASEMIPKMMAFTGISNFFKKYSLAFKQKDIFTSEQERLQRSFIILFKNLNKVKMNKCFPEIYSLLTQIYDLVSSYISETSEDYEDLFYTSSSSESSKSSTPPIDIVYPEIKLQRKRKPYPEYDNFEQLVKEQEKHYQNKQGSIYS